MLEWLGSLGYLLPPEASPGRPVPLRCPPLGQLVPLGYSEQQARLGVVAPLIFDPRYLALAPTPPRPLAASRLPAAPISAAVPGVSVESFLKIRDAPG